MLKGNCVQHVLDVTSKNMYVPWAEIISRLPTSFFIDNGDDSFDAPTLQDEVSLEVFNP
jgi:hypothetical protein